MNSFEFGSNSLFDSFREVEEGVYFKHYGMELPYNEAMQETVETNSFGNFEAKPLFWQKQIDALADGIALKSVIDRSLCGYNICQRDITKECAEKGLFHPDCGSSFDDLVELLKQDNSDDKGRALVVDVISNGSLTELAEYVDSGDEVICYVNRMLMNQNHDYSYPGLNADGLVHVIGISFSDTDGDFLIINDTSNDNGAGMRIPLESFLKAWSTSDYTAITVARR